MTLIVEICAIKDVGVVIAAEPEQQTALVPLALLPLQCFYNEGRACERARTEAGSNFNDNVVANKP